MNPLFIDNLDFSRKKYIKKESFFKKKVLILQLKNLKLFVTSTNCF